MKTVLYKIIVLSLKVAAWAATKHGCISGILADAEGDSGYNRLKYYYK